MALNTTRLNRTHSLSLNQNTSSIIKQNLKKSSTFTKEQMKSLKGIKILL